MEEWECSLAIINLSFVSLKIYPVRIQCLEAVLKRMYGTIPSQGSISETTREVITTLRQVATMTITLAQMVYIVVTRGGMVWYT